MRSRLVEEKPMPLFKRSDGDLVPSLDPIRLMMPLIMPRRNDSVVYHKTRWDISRTRKWLRAFNNARQNKPHATLFHLVLWGSGQMLHARTGLNRFVSNGNIYQRRGVSVSFAVKTRFEDGAPLTTVKLALDAGQPFETLLDSVAAAVHDGRSNRVSPIEKEVRILMRLPRPLLRMVLWGGRWLDRHNVLPTSFIEPDPMYSSLFLANLGSIHIDNAYHHLYEYGTCSLFGVIGKPHKTVQTDRAGRTALREILPAQWTFDERVNDGYYCVESLDFLRRIVENPQNYVPTAVPHSEAGMDSEADPITAVGPVPVHGS
jgi:hypothetical protein